MKDGDDLQQSVSQHRNRLEHEQRDGGHFLTHSLALIGSIGWLIVTPTLAGLFLGRWLDRSLGTGIFWSATLLFLGVSFGCWLAWKRIEEK